MYIKVDKVKYNNISYEITPNISIKYYGSTLPKFTSPKTIIVYNEDGTKLREDKVSSYHRYESNAGSLLLTNSKLIEYKNAVYTADSPIVIAGSILAGEYAGQVKLEDGIIVERIEEVLEPINIEAPIYKKWAGDVFGLRIPVINTSRTEWIEGCTDKDAWDAAHPYQASDTERIAAAEKAVLALMNKVIGGK